MTSEPTLPAVIEYSAEWVELICGRISRGESVRKIGGDAGWPSKPTIMAWLTRHEDFRTAYAIACELRAEHLAEEALEIADDASRDTKVVGDGDKAVCDQEWVSRSRLRVDTRKWMAAKMAPKKWGERQVIEHSGGIAVDAVDRPANETREEWLERRKREMGAAAGAATGGHNR